LTTRRTTLDSARTSTRAVPTFRCRLAAAFTLGIASLVALPTISLAQLQTLPAEVIGSQAQLGTDQKSQVKTFVESAFKGLSGDAKALREARTTLLAPLLETQVGLSFRTEYSQALTPGLAELAKTGGTKGVNAIVILGEVATSSSLEVIEGLLESTDAGTRFAAASAIGASLDQVRTRTPVLQESRLTGGTLAKLAGRLKAENDQIVLDALTRAMIAAGRVNQPGYESLREKALDTLAVSLTERLIGENSLGNQDLTALQSMLRALVAIRDELLVEERNRGNGGTRMKGATLEHLAIFAGESLALSARLIKDPAIAPAIATAEADEGVSALKARTLIGQISGTAQASVYLIGPLLERGPVGQSSVNLGSLPSQAKNESDARFLTAISELVGPGGTLSKDPYAIKRAFKLPG